MIDSRLTRATYHIDNRHDMSSFSRPRNGRELLYEGVGFSESLPAFGRRRRITRKSLAGIRQTRDVFSAPIRHRLPQRSSLRAADTLGQSYGNVPVA